MFDASGGLFVDRSLTVIGGPGDETIHTHEGKVGRSVKLGFGKGSGRAYLFFDTIEGGLTARYGTDSTSFHVFALAGLLRGSLRSISAMATTTSMSLPHVACRDATIRRSHRIATKAAEDLFFIR